MTVTPLQTVYKDPDAKLLYVFDWTAWLAAGATITSSTFTLTGADGALTKDNPSILSGSLKTQVRLLGGTAGVVYKLTNHITSTDSPAQEDDRSIYVKCREQ
jgi:hypothetical protein